jgi:hypothetical protein
MEHRPGGNNGPNKCRCGDCREAHNARMRMYRATHRKPMSKLDLELLALRSFRDGVLAARAAGQEQVTS